MNLRNADSIFASQLRKNTMTNTMNAMVFTSYGSPEVLKLSTVAKPIPQDNEVLIKIKATAVNSGDVRLRAADPFAVRLFLGLTRPRLNILGVVYAGEIESIGKEVKLFKVGDKVFGHTDMSFGTYANYKCVNEASTIAISPPNFSFEEAATIPFGALTALYFIKKANIQAGQKVLIVGASGAVGSAAVQIAKSFGAMVTGVCSTSNLELVKSIGADKVIDYTKEDFTKNEIVYDVIFDTVNGISVCDSLTSLSKTGTMILSAAGLTEMLKGAIISMTSKRKVLTGVISHNKEDINYLKELMEQGKLKAVIDRTYKLEQMAEAHAYVDKGHKKGNVAISIAS